VSPSGRRGAGPPGGGPDKKQEGISYPLIWVSPGICFNKNEKKRKIIIKIEKK
jgi:hypothetical protein